MFDGQRHSQDSREVPHYTALLEFLDLQAHASENSMSATNQRRQTASSEKLTMKLSYHVNIADTCVACKLGKHLLYTCRKFMLLPHGQMMVILKDHGHSINCPKQGILSNNVLVPKSAGNVRSLIIPGSIMIKKL